MEESCTATTLRNLPIAGRVTGNCVFLHAYTLRGKQRLGHSIWNNGKLALFDPSSWLWNYTQITPTKCKGPSTTTHLIQLPTYAFAHTVNALIERNFGELIVGLQTMYSSQIINGAEHLPIKTNVVARVYSTPPYIIEIVR